MKHLPIFVALHPSPSEGEILLEEKYPTFVNHLRESLRKSGFEDKASSKGVMRFRFERLISALVSVYEALETFRSDFLNNDEEITLPAKFIFHYIAHSSDPLPPFCETGSSIWHSLKSETLYVSRALKLKWSDLQDTKKEVPCKFELEDEGIYRAEFNNKPQFSTTRLFNYRHLFAHGSYQECFYCGLRSHAPAKCPSKGLTMETQGIQSIGYIPFKEINDLFIKVFQNPDSVHHKLVAGITPGQLKSDKELIAYTSLFDIFRVFQPRFLHNIAFAHVNKWRTLTSNQPKKLNLDDSNLNLALDCLRVGQYEDAEKKLLAATGHQEPKLFYAYVGLAFLALEKGRMKDMGHFLDTACSNATKEKEKVYISLLLVRYYKLTGDLWKAQNTLTSLFKIKHNLREANYLSALIEVSSGFSQKAIGELRDILNGPKEFFMVLMLDPQLLPFHGFIDEILQAKLEVVKKEADEQIAHARSAVNDALLWLEKDDKREKDLTEAMDTVNQQSKSGTLYDATDVLDKSRDLCALCKEIIENCLDEITNKKQLLSKGLSNFVSFWNLYPYKNVFKKTLEKINTAKEKFSRLERFIKSKRAEGYKQASVLIKDIEALHEELQKSLVKMKRFELFMHQLKKFARKLLITECILLLALLPLFLFIFPESTFATDAIVQKKIFLIAGLIIAPAIALSLCFNEFTSDKISSKVQE